MPEVQRVTSRTVQQRKKRRRVMHKISWKPLFALAMLPPMFIVAVLIFDRLSMIRIPMPRATPPMQSAQQQVIYVTATPNPDLILTATGVLPPEYLQSLQQTPFAPTATLDPSLPTQIIPTSTPPFVSQGTEGPRFSLLTTKIVYVCWVDALYKDEICLMNADGSNKRQLTNMRGTDYYPSLSPDGQTIVFSSQRDNNNFDIYAMNTEGGDIRQLTDTDADEYAPEISPDGSQIVFTHAEDRRQSIWVMNADGSNPHPVTFGDYSDIDPSWSPQGDMISFTSNRDGTNEIFVMNVDGSNIRQVTVGMSNGGRTDWSPDGKLIAFYAGPGERKELFMVPIECSLIGGGCDRSLIRQLTFDTCSQAPAFSPDGQWITFATHGGCDVDKQGADARNEIAIMNLQTGDIIQLTTNKLSDWMARWGW
jgi:Tol biopolymer transport system component